MNYRYKQSGVWLTTKEPDHGIADCIFEGSLMAYAFDDYEVLEVHADLLWAGLRWPPNMIHSFRSIHSITRDPFLAHWFACWKMDRKQFIEVTPLPWWLRRRYAHSFWKYLVYGKEKHLRIFERNLKRLLWWGSKTAGLHTMFSNSKVKLIRQLRHKVGINSYSLHLWCLMAHVSDSDKAIALLAHHVPLWNHFLWLLLYCPFVDDEEIHDYVPQEGYQWTGWELRTDRPIDDEYPLDKQLLKKLVIYIDS